MEIEPILVKISYSHHPDYRAFALPFNFIEFIN